jgi:hypothetical protein
MINLPSEPGVEICSGRWLFPAERMGVPVLVAILVVVVLAQARYAPPGFTGSLKFRPQVDWCCGP